MSVYLRTCYSAGLNRATGPCETCPSVTFLMQTENVWKSRFISRFSLSCAGYCCYVYIFVIKIKYYGYEANRKCLVLNH